MKDGEETCFYREDIIGVLREEHLPEWAEERLQEMQETEEKQSGGIVIQ